MRSRFDVPRLRHAILVAAGVAAAAFWLRSAPAPGSTHLLDMSINELLRQPLRAETTVVLIVGTQCPYTKRSVPFYQTLLRERPDTSFLIAGYETPEVLEAFATDIGLTNVPVAQLAPAAMAQIGATPTLLYLSSEHIPTRVWVGLLSPQSQEDARTALRALTASTIAQ